MISFRDTEWKDRRLKLQYHQMFVYKEKKQALSSFIHSSILFPYGLSVHFMIRLKFSICY